MSYATLATPTAKLASPTVALASRPASTRPATQEKGLNPDGIRYKWLQVAIRRIAPAYKVRPAERMPMVRNRLINRAYAEMYFTDPSTYKWAGAAIFASHSAGKKLELLKQLNNLSTATLITSFGTALPMWLASSQLGYLYKAVALGNKAIYLDIYWQHLAYRAGGIAELEKVYRQGEISEKLLHTWQMLDEGRQIRDQELIWKANIDLLEHEQKEVIQPVLYEGEKNRAVWELVCATDGLFGGLVTSPVPEETRGFRDCVSGGNLANYDERWKWCTEHIMPAWRAYETKNPRKVKALIEQIIK